MQASGGVIQGGLIAQRGALEAELARQAGTIAAANKSAEMSQGADINAAQARLASGLDTTRNLAVQSSAGQIAATAAEKQQQFELQKAALLASLPTPEEREVTAYTGGATRGSAAYQKGVQDLALLKAGITPDLYSSSTSAPAGSSSTTTGTPAPTGQGTSTPSLPSSGSSPAAPSSYTPIAPPLTTPPPGGFNESVLAGKPAWLVASVHAINEGREEPPSPRAMDKPGSPEFIKNALVNQYNPNFDATLYPARLEAQKAIAPGGSLFTPISSMNVSLGHAAHFLDLANQLGNYGGGNWANVIPNNLAASTGAGRLVNNLKQTAFAMAEEGNKIYAGNAGTETAIDNWYKSFPINGSLAEQVGAVQNFAQLMGDKFDTMTYQTNKALGSHGPPIELLDPKSAATYQRLIGMDIPGTAPRESSGVGAEGLSSAVAAPSAPKPPAIGEVQQGYSFTGGNPADPASWKAVK